MAKIPYTINKHSWTYGDTNEYCVHCGQIIDSDFGTLGVTAECKNRIPNDEKDFNETVKSYAFFNNYKWNHDKQAFIKPYQNHLLTYKDMVNKVNEALK